jgi:DNA-binding response OmpR family regulator
MMNTTIQPRQFRLLLIVPDPAIVSLLLRRLAQPALHCRHARDARSGLAEFHRFEPHLVVVQHALPDQNGCELCRRIRESGVVPIIVLDVCTESDQLSALYAGADECIGPSSFHSLCARIAAQLRRVYRYDGLDYKMPLHCISPAPIPSPPAPTLANGSGSTPAIIPIDAIKLVVPSFA